MTPDDTTPPIAAPSWSLIRILRALGNQDRLSMFTIIAQAPKGLSVAQVATRFGGKRSVVGKHLAILRSAEIVTLRTETGDDRAVVHILHPALRPPEGAPLVLEMGDIAIRLG